ncbi:MAG: sugar phosphate isomerase/epimerase [Acidobacteriota bacterium]|nr:sugar phosphate isomerase/epimerase [Acidobacteriota bacterium]
MGFQFRQAICNEVYGKAPLAEVCRSIRRIGYEGIEIAPFTLADRPTEISPEQRRHYRELIQSEGLQFVGLHWLMVSPKGLHVTTPDPALRQRGWDHIRELIDLCADLGDDGVMVFGSPQQRATTGGVTRSEAIANYTEGLAGVAAQALDRRVTILVEALPLNQCDVINSLAEAVSVVEQIGSPAVRTMFDTHNAVDQSEPHATLVDRYFDYVRHVHVNELDGRHPGTADYDFRAIFEVLRHRNYRHWISMEAFDFSPGAEKIATESLRYLEKEIQKIAA